jgi:voltage-dependent potassium channel beta subunit
MARTVVDLNSALVGEGGVGRNGRGAERHRITSIGTRRIELARIDQDSKQGEISVEMEYRHLGRSGLQVSVLSFGSWVTFGPQLAGDLAADCLAAAYDAGVNFFDNAEAYSAGESERIMGDAIAKLGWPRHSYVLSTKLFWGVHNSVNMRNTLNRKYLLEAIDGSLERFGLDFVDLVYCHRADPHTAMEETVWAMSDIITSGKALYWGTSEWTAAEIREAWDIADRHHLHKPVVEQPQYNLFVRDRVEKEYAPLYQDVGLGLTTWSPLASGLLSGKYLDRIPEASRATLPGYEWLKNMLTDEDKNAKVRELQSVARELDCTLSQLSIAWCAKNPHVSSVITGASRVEQVTENLVALEVLPKLTDEVVARIDAITA